MVESNDAEFSARMERAEEIIRRARDLGMSIELSDGKLLIRNWNVTDDVRFELRYEVKQHARDIAEWLSIPPADVTDRVAAEYDWLREFAEEFARTAWRRLGRLPENEFIQLYNLAVAEYDDDKPPKIEPGLAALMAIADARMEQCIDIARRAEVLAQRDGSDPEDWAQVLASNAEIMAREGRWRGEKDHGLLAELPF